MSLEDDIKTCNDLIRESKRRLRNLKLKKARQGMSADPSVDIEIEDIEQEIADLELQKERFTEGEPATGPMFFMERFGNRIRIDVEGPVLLSHKPRFFAFLERIFEESGE